ncbi:hypothetical protein [Luteimonas fraxinea]|uniref:ArsR family transcriptional regulator n=1 Tax=Luteimonas fraxinea TaxID=2901869 RepID=A0ABS8UCW4_9GAMM|nr:hypothetical protein [Luteimonas fraxinea]MCD9097074.1 hypothetical protein [Luteimonas fraxinea]
MPRSQDVFTPQIRAALLAAATAPHHRLRRCAGGFTAPPAERVRAGGSATVPVITRRTVLRLERDGLVMFDEGHEYSTTVTLTPDGVDAVRELRGDAAVDAVA